MQKFAFQRLFCYEGNMRIDDLRVKIDRAADCIPGLSTVTNLVDLFQKTVVAPKISHKDHYYQLLEKKSVVRCVLLAIPIVGQMLKVFDYFSDFFCFRSHREKTVRDVSMNGMQLKDVGKGLQNDFEAVMAAVKNDGMALQFASDRLKNNKVIVLEAVRQNRNSFQFVGFSLQNDPQVLRARRFSGDGTSL